MFEPVIRIRKLSKIYDNKVLALDNISLEINKGEIFSLLGPNGAGKTTLIKILTGQLRPSSGEVSIFGISFRNFLKSPVRFKISYVPQENIIWEDLTVEENILFMASMYRISRNEAKEILMHLLEELELSNVRKRLASKLSGGMKRKLSIAMALVNDPDILILDEPTAGLDPTMRAILLSDIEKFKSEGKTIVLTTHIVEEAERLSTRVAIIKSGKIIVVGSPRKLKEEICGFEILDLLFRKLGNRLAKSVLRVIGEKEHVVVGDRLLVKGKELISILSELRRNPMIYEQLLNASIRKSNLEDAFLFLNGSPLVGE